MSQCSFTDQLSLIKRTRFTSVTWLDHAFNSMYLRTGSLLVPYGLLVVSEWLHLVLASIPSGMASFRHG